MKKITIRVIYGLLVGWLFLNCFVNNVYGKDYFLDDFSVGNLDKWILNIGDSSWVVGESQLKGTVNTNSQFWIYAKIDEELTDYTVELDAKNESGIDQHILVRANPDTSSYYQIEFRYLDEFWPQDGGSIRIWRFNNGYFSQVGVDTTYILEKGVYHKIKIKLEGNSIFVYIDGLLVKSENDLSEDAINSGGFGFHNYAGNYWARPVVNYFDNLKIYDEKIEPDVKPKIILIPGLGASWNERAMVFNQEIDNSEWRMTPFVENYDNLVTAFKDSGLVEDLDFFVWNYDWRKPVLEIKNDLDSFVDEKIPDNEKVSFVGHSLGGLVSRDWAQDHNDDPRLGEVITLGSPHLGSVDAYRVWSGGKISETVDASGIALNVLLQLQKKNGENKVDTIKRYAPVVKDLIPVFDFIKKSNRVIPVNQMAERNNYLMSINTESSLGGKLSTWSGSGLDTAEWVKLGTRNRFEQFLGWWPEGKIMGYDYGDGDQIVLVRSSNFGDNYEQLDGDHGNLPNLYGNKVLQKLGIEGDYNWELSDGYTNKWVFYIGSPADIRVICDGGVKAESSDFILINGQDADGCELKVVGKENGKYHLAYGLTSNENSWGYIERDAQAGKEESFRINTKKGILEFSGKMMSEDIMGLLKEMKVKYPKNIAIDMAINSAKKSRWEEVLTELFVIRRMSGDRVISSKILDELWYLMASGKGNKTMSDWWYQKSLANEKNIETVSSKLKIGEKQAMSYAYWTTVMDRIKSSYSGKDYAGVEAGGKIGNLLVLETMF